MKRILIGLAPFILGLAASILVTALVKPELVLNFQVGLGVIVVP